MFAAKFKLKTRAAVFKVSGPAFKKRLGPPKGKTALGATDKDLNAVSIESIKIPKMEYLKLTDFPKPDLSFAEPQLKL